MNLCVTHSTMIIWCLLSALGARDTSVNKMGRNSSSQGVHILEGGGGGQRGGNTYMKKDLIQEAYILSLASSYPTL